MDILKACSVIEFFVFDQYQSAIDISYAVDIEAFKNEIANNLIDDKIILDSTLTIDGFRNVPDVIDSTNPILEIDKNIYAIIRSDGKKKIPSGLIRNEVKREVAKYTAEHGAISEDVRKGIVENVTADVFSKAFMQYTNTIALLDLSNGKLGRLYIGTTSKTIVNDFAQSIFDSLALKDGCSFEYTNDLVKQADDSKGVILDKAIFENSHEIRDIVFNKNEGQDVIKLHSSTDLLTDEEFSKQIKDNLNSLDVDMKMYSYFSHDANAKIENKGVTSAKYHALGLKVKYEGEYTVNIDDLDDDKFIDFKSDLIHSINVLKDVIKDIVDNSGTQE